MYEIRQNEVEIIAHDPITGVTIKRPRVGEYSESEISQVLKDEIIELKIQWLEKNDYDESDVKVDAKGREFVLEENEGSPDEEGLFTRLYLEY